MIMDIRVEWGDLIGHRWEENGSKIISKKECTEGAEGEKGSIEKAKKLPKRKNLLRTDLTQTGCVWRMQEPNTFRKNLRDSDI